VFVAEEVDARFSTTVVEAAFHKDTQHGAFASVDYVESASILAHA
jgi:hypothetical protein